MSSVINDRPRNQRVFPRVVVSCPVLYLVPSSNRWQVGTLVNFSATGIKMVCDDVVVLGAEISVQIKPGSQKTVPALSASGVVLRCEINDAMQYVVSCKLTKVQR